MPQKKHIAIALELDEDYEHHQGLYRGILRYAKERGDWLCSIDEHPGYEPPGGRRAVKHTYDGVIARAWPNVRQHIDRLGIPFVNTLHRAKGVCQAGVYTDVEAVGRLAAEHLIERGFRRLVSVFQPDHVYACGVTAAFKRCAVEYGLDYVEFQMIDSEDIDEAKWVTMQGQVHRLLHSLVPPTALFIELPLIARLVAQYSVERGLRVPLDLAIVCDCDLTPSMDVSPTISAVQYNYERVGYEAAQLLDELMSGQAVQTTCRHIPPAGLVARESTDYFATEDPVVAAALRHIASNITRPLYTEDIAEAVGVSPRSLHDKFNTSLGRSVAQEVRRLRLAMAKRLLTEHDRSVAEIARLTGFADGKSLAQIFRREIGMTPTEYRRKHSRV